jgi:hypothetical protein
MKKIEQVGDYISCKLSVPIKVHGMVDGKNELVDCEELFLKAPTLKHRNHTIQLKKKFFEATMGMTAFSQDDAQKQLNSPSEGDDSSDNMTAQQILTILYASKGFDILDFFKAFEEFLLNGICFTDSDLSSRIKPSSIDKIDESDFEKLISEYIEFFFIVSWMKTLQAA